MEGLLIFVIILIIVVLVTGVRIINQYERGVVLTLGRYSGMKEPGLRLLIPILQQMTKVDVRSTPVDVPQQEVITKDNVTIKVDAVVYFRAVNAARAVLETNNYRYATAQFAQAALRDVVGNVEMDQLLGQREQISQQIKQIVDAETDKWGIDVENVKIQNIELPQDMKRAMAKQAEAERERRSVIITAEGEKAAAQQVAEAAAILSRVPGGMGIRTLQTLEKIAVEPSQKTVFVLPADFADAFKKFSGQ
ncbi:MAG TPA: slipin family protein [Candidatus Saccharimonadales bacterium]|nr:slipin family protein [Candidatus Saccharimonadales bacterium]